MTVDDFEWVEYGGFDKWYLMHKTLHIAIAKVYPYNGWHVVIDGQPPSQGELIVDSFDAAKTVATMLAAQQMERYQDENRYFKRTPNLTSQAVPRGVFKLA